MLILDLCGGTGAWSAPYRSAGYRTLIVDPGDFDDALPRLRLRAELVRLADIPGPVHGVLAAPPCTHLAGSGARWWAAKGEPALLESLATVDACIRLIHALRPAWWALENPVGRLVHYLGKPALTFNPCDYGDPWTKRTLLWGRFNPPQPSPVVPITPNPIHHCPPGPDRQRIRSATPPGFARAFFTANP